MYNSPYNYKKAVAMFLQNGNNIKYNKKQHQKYEKKKTGI